MTHQQQTDNDTLQAVNPWVLAALLVAVFAACLTIHLRDVGGDFLSDDFSHISWIADAQNKGQLREWLIGRFYRPLDSGNFAYRPVVFASYALDWVLYRTNASGWHLTNLAIHLINSVLIMVLVARLAIRTGLADTRFAATAAATLFAALPFAGESTFWPVGRFDLLACMFSFGFLIFLADTPKRSSAWGTVGGLVCLLLALLSKESAMPMLAVGFALVLACSIADQRRAGHASAIMLTAAIRQSLSRYWPMVALALVYFIWRNYLFGSPWKVYPDSHFPGSIGEFATRVATLKYIFTYPYGEHAALWWALIVLCSAAWLAGLPSAVRRASFSAIVLTLALFGCFLAYLLAPATSFPIASPSGEGIRNLYFSWGMFSLFAGFAIAYHRIRLLLLCVILIIAIWGQWRMVALWHYAAAEMSRVTLAIPALAAAIDDKKYALLLLPDHVGAAPFVRNAQGGLVMPPRQKVAYLHKMAPMTPMQFAEWEGHFANNKIGELKGPGILFDRANFSGVYCWQQVQGRFQLLDAKPNANAAKEWEAETMKEATVKGCLL